MARHTASVCKLCRREKMKLFLKGARCESARCAMESRAYPPGDHSWRRTKVSEYGMQLREKQKAKRFYGVLERQFARCFERAAAQKGNTGEALLVMLESRMDNVVFRSGLALSRAHARQMIAHGLFRRNGRRTDIPSCLVKLGDSIAVKPTDRHINLVKGVMEQTRSRERTEWLEVSTEPPTIKVLRMPTREDVSVPVQEQLIVEFQSK